MLKISRTLNILKQIFNLPKVSIAFKKYSIDTVGNYKRTYNYFTKLHRLKLFKKTLGIGLT
jgi:hypothetical protein